jgi:2-isopropylmalate synthase
VRQRLEQLGHSLGDDAFLGLFERFKELADRKKAINERDLLLLLAGEDGPRAPIALRGALA